LKLYLPVDHKGPHPFAHNTTLYRLQGISLDYTAIMGEVATFPPRRVRQSMSLSNIQREVKAVFLNRVGRGH